MNKNTISKWFSMFLLMMVAGITGATAQSLTVADFTLEQGQMTEVNIKLAAPADQTIYGVQTDITLSEGLILEEVAAVNAELQFDKNIVAGGATRVALLSLAGASIPAGDVIKLHVKAADNFVGGTISLTNSKLTTSTAGAETSVEDATATVKMTPTTVLIKPTISITEEYTSIAALDGKTFAIVNKADGKALYGSNAQNLAYDVYTNAFSSSNSGYLWKLVSLADNADESIRGYYMLHLITPKGEEYKVWGSNPGFLNSQNETGWCSFILGLNNQNGQDIKNGAVFDVQYEEGKGFSLKNIGTGLYKGANTGTANATEPVYFTFAAVGSTYVPAVEALLAEGAAWKTLVTDEAALTAYNTAVANIDPTAITGDGQAEAKAVDAAIVELSKAQPAEAGAVFTRAIVNPSFEYGNIDGWTSKDGGNAVNNGNFGAATGSFFVEKWTPNTGKLSNGTFLQTIKGLPNGKYKLTAQMQNREQGNGDAAGTGFFLVANEGKTEAVDNNGKTFEVIGTTKRGGRLEIGTKLENCSGNWICFDNFQLTFVEAVAAPVEVTDTFNFAAADFREKVGTAMNDVNGNIYNETFTAGGATLQVTAGSAASKLYKDNNRGQNLVTYKEYTTLTFKAPEGKAIVQIDFTAAGNSNINNFTASSGVIEGMSWIGEAEGVRFAQGGTSYLANAIVTMIDKTASTEALPAIEYTECANIAAFNALAAGTYAKVTLTDAEVIGKSADGYSTVWMQDATGGCWIQYTSLNDKLAEKTKVNGTVYAVLRANSGNTQMKEAEATLQSELNATAIESYTAVAGTIAEVNVAANLNKVVKIAADSLVMTSASVGILYVGETSIDVNNGTATANQQLCKIADWAKDTKLENITIEAILVAKSATANQLLPISIVETTTPEPPVVPTITATLEHTATSYCEGDADVYTSNVDAETEHVNNNKFNSTWQGAAYAEFSFAELPANATITEAILTFKGIGESRNARNTDVMLVNAGETLDYTALAAGNAKVNLDAANIQSVSFPKASSQVFTINATEQLNALVAGGQRYAIFKFTNNPGGGDIAGKASENDAPTLVITYALGAPAIANASFEADGEKAASNSPLELTGWTFAGVGTQFNNTELRGANSESTTSQFGTSAPNDGDYALFFRQGWNGNGNVITITSDSLTEIPSGDYLLSVAYKQHYSYDNTTSENTFVGLSLVNGETTIATGNSPAATGVNGGSADATYFNDTEWSTLEVPFSLNEAVAAGAQIVITLNAGGQRRSDFFLDNVKLEKVPGIEVALKELEKAIAAAQTKAGAYTVGEGLFMYAASEIEPLNTAIATAQAAYTAAESKAAIEAATDSLNAFVGRFAPVATTPDADKAYTFLNKQANLYMTLSADGISIAEEPYELKFEAAEGGKYYVTDGTNYVGIAGTDNWTMTTEAGKKEALTIAATVIDGAAYYTLAESKGLIGVDYPKKENMGCWANKGTGDGDAVLWTIAEYVAPTELAQTLNVERYAGLGYTAQEATVDFTEAKTFLGVEEVTTEMLRIVNPNDSLISDYATYDGWFNGEGAAETWGTNTKVCVKFFQAIPEGKFEICDMNGADSIGATYTVKWALVANDKQVTYTINVKFVEKPVIDLKFADLSVMDTKTVALTSELGKCYEGLTADVDVAAILTKLGVTSLNDVTIYAVQRDGSLDDNYKLGTTDGWRDSAGNWQTWGDAAYFYVKADFSKESAQIYEAGGMDGKNTTAQWQSPATYTATYAFVKTGTADAVVLKVTLTYTVPTGINAIARDAQKNVIFNLNGQKVNKAQKGLFIINGKKVVNK